MKTTQRQYRFFIDAFQGWQRRLGLVAYCVQFKLEYIDDNTWAQVESDSLAKTAFVTLNSIPPDAVTDEIIESTARHEAFHLLLSRLVSLGKDRYVRETEIDIEEEKVVRTIDSIFETP